MLFRSFNYMWISYTSFSVSCAFSYDSCLQIQNLEDEIEEKKSRVKNLEQLINESGEASVVKASLVEMQQVFTFLLF